MSTATTNTDYALPETIRYSCEPYTYNALLGNLRWEGEYNGKPILVGEILEGTETAYLMGHARTKSAVGQRVRVYGTGPIELGRGHIIRFAM